MTDYKELYFSLFRATEKAISLHKSFKEDIDLAEERITKGISAEELELLRSVLSRIRDNLSSAKDMEE